MTKKARDKQSEIDRNLVFFKKKLPDLLNHHRGRYVLLRDKEIVGIYDTVRDAQMTGQKFYDDELFSIQKVEDRAIELGYFSHAVHLGRV